MSDPVVESGAELSVDDVEQFTAGRLAADNPETQRLLDSAVAAARRYCGWHVSPVWAAHQIILDGHGGRVLRLPTKHLITVDDVIEDGTTLNVDELTWNTAGIVRKTSHAAWKCGYRVIDAVITDGYTSTEAADWRQAVLTMVSLMASGNRPDSELIVKKVDDVQYQWGSTVGADQALLSVSGVLDAYQVGQVFFA